MLEPPEMLDALPSIWGPQHARSSERAAGRGVHRAFAPLQERVAKVERLVGSLQALVGGGVNGRGGPDEPQGRARGPGRRDRHFPAKHSLTELPTVRTKAVLRVGKPLLGRSPESPHGHSWSRLHASTGQALRPR